ncbi:hypothetical protein EDB85DRAFT_2290404 [Lactarius pseudohatsudake]|nr:hypothetical protein EDB85DRAFT_2290404 [Lactarius pseudohatsudake]
MAAAKDMEHRQMSSNSSGPSSSQDAGTGCVNLLFCVPILSQEPTSDRPQIAESQESSSQLRVQVAVLRAHNIPHTKSRTKFYVTVTSQTTTTTNKTSSVPTEESIAEWNEDLDTFIVQPSSRLVLRLYEKRRVLQDILIGTHEMMPVESRTNVPFPLSNDDVQAEQSIQPIMLYLTVAVSPAENALHDANEAMTTINLSNILDGVLERIKWVMDTVSPVAELHPYAKMAYGLLFAIPKTLLEQFQRDDNIGTLLVAMHDAFDFANQEDRFKAIRRGSRQAQILTLMLQHVCNCCDFIRSYANDSQFWNRILKNTGNQVDKKIEDFRATLLDQRKTFLDEATITTEITALQILDDVGIISADVDRISSQLDGMTTQLKWVSSQVSDAELDVKIREIPYGTGPRFTPDKGCLIGTRTAFLDFIANWVNDPASERCLVLFGQAGTGKSSIAHEIARRFHKMHRLTSSFIFLRKEQSKREAYRLFTTLARDLSDRYPSFKVALGKVVKDNISLRVGTRDYDTLFESLILAPLKDLHIVGPILVVIDALDESGDVTGENGLHKFIANAISKLPSNFRMLITSRPEYFIESAFVGDGLAHVKIKYMNDSELAATTHGDILAFLQNMLPPDVFKIYGDELTKRAEGLFTWAAVACGYIIDPPDVFGLSKSKCIKYLLKHTADRRGQDPLDELYKEVLEGYFTHENSRLLFRSVLGQLIASIEPLSIRSLTTLRKTHASHDDNDDDDSDTIVAVLRRLGSLLSNVNSSDESLPIVPLHTSLRDFLTNEAKSGC